jgi:hypothetical protein
MNEPTHDSLAKLKKLKQKLEAENRALVKILEAPPTFEPDQKDLTFHKKKGNPHRDNRIVNL